MCKAWQTEMKSILCDSVVHLLLSPDKSFMTHRCHTYNLIIKVTNVTGSWWIRDLTVVKHSVYDITFANKSHREKNMWVLLAHLKIKPPFSSPSFRLYHFTTALMFLRGCWMLLMPVTQWPILHTLIVFLTKQIQQLERYCSNFHAEML